MIHNVAEPLSLRLSIELAVYILLEISEKKGLRIIARDFPAHLHRVQIDALSAFVLVQSEPIV